MKKVGKPMFFVVLALIAALTALTFLGFAVQEGDMVHKYVKSTDDIRWGIDIRGGVDVTFSPPEGYNATREEMDAATSVIKVRMVSQNITDSEVYTDYNKNRIIVRFPWRADESDYNPEKAVSELGETALLTFREGTGAEGTVVIEGKHVVSARPEMGADTGKWGVSLKLNGEGTRYFADATGRLVGSQISIWMDDVMISAPVVNSRIPNGEAQITGTFTMEEAADLANKINAGALPFKLETENFSSISPTLGLGARNAMVLAGVIALGLICLLMIILYRIPGLVASIALVGQVAGMIAALTGFFPQFPSFTLTLPGIAGIILSVGMGVDANVITSERIREELANGRPLASAIDSGFSRTFAAIFDSNITMVLVAVVLMGAFGPPGSIFNTLLSPVFRWFGPSATGAIYSFGFTLIAGVVCNFVMAVTASRLMLKSISQFKPLRNPRLYGGAK